ncbi:type II toxin-antitoxin system RelE/ParE family toxin [Paraburkholderia sp. 31.1]|uniref:type II toxin-antitoxin system RelE/ParE family toxin n=1 Tax=Paraburkholderia sp. 31.1 TaxID=2615205 RepID=UPI00223B2FD4|nr:type II toxin-antitoxin system RelE/ParE family toxin [Paraburkholderia sp. 31.1]
MAASRRQVRLTPLAESDLEDIWRYTSSNWSVDQADRYHRDLLSTIGRWRGV